MNIKNKEQHSNLKLEKFASGKTIKLLLVSRIGCGDETPWSQKKGILEIEEPNLKMSLNHKASNTAMEFGCWGRVSFLKSRTRIIQPPQNNHQRNLLIPNQTLLW
jgi:hypothetical protein